MVIFTGIKAVLRPSSTADTGNAKEPEFIPSPADISRNRREHSIRGPSKSRRTRTRLLVVKLGGSSLSSPAKIRHASESIVREYSRGNRLVIVVSAVGNTTNELLRLTNGGAGMVESDRDDIVAMGERTSARIIAASLKSHGVQSRYFDPSDRDWPIITDDNFQDANPIRGRSIERIRKYVKPVVDHGMVPVIAGFIGRTRDGRISTLGRGGSDTTALLLATALQADEVVLVTNVGGILTADPRIVNNARPLSQIDIQALTGIADSGTKFIHRKALQFKDPSINIRVVSNTAGLQSAGTLITGGPVPELEVKVRNPHRVASITLVGRNLSRKPQFMKRIAKIAGPVLEAVSQDPDSTILYMKQTPSLKRTLAKLHRIIQEDPNGIALAARMNNALMTVKGVGLEDTPGVVAKIAEALRLGDTNLFGILTITSSVTLLVEWAKRKKAARLIRIALENN